MKVPVLLVGNFLSATGGSRCVCEELALRLAHNGHQVLTTSNKRPRLRRLLDMTGTVLRRRRDYAVAQVDVYSGPAFLWAEIVSAMLRALGKPFILTLHGGNLPQFARKNSWRMRRLLAMAQAVTAPSEYLCREMAPYRPDVKLLLNALEVGHYTFRLRAHPLPKLVWVRAFHEIYNPTLAPRLLARVLPRFPEARLTMVGPDKGDHSLEDTCRVAERLGVRHRLQLPGQVPKESVPDWLAQSDVFLNTTNVDNAPVSVLEAMATGLCLVSTNVGGLSDLLQDAHDALMVQPNDEVSMGTAVTALLTQDGLAERLSGNARAKAEARDWSAILPQWERLLEQVVPSTTDPA